MFKKGSHWLPLFDEAIVANRLLLRRIFKKYADYKKPTKCKQAERRTLPLSIQPYIGVLILFAIGTFSALFIFGAELLKQNVRSRIE